MIVVHPKDPSTRFLHLIYEELENVRFFNSMRQREQIIDALRTAPKDEMILLLGHGTPHGLIGGFICDDDAELLQDRPNLVGVWCFASTFARRHKLKGFFTGMFISEWGEAVDNGVEAGYEEIIEENWRFAGVFGDLLRSGHSLEETAGMLMDKNNNHSELTSFNYSRLTYRRTGLEPLPVAEDYWGQDPFPEEI